ncbi:Clavaminate synthase-like protein [Coprinopsis marcescibilis]|uniref:Clavaminate synthase-like protein n=1 Tax=Coprinopsis marcescibilis TaxID=230819 RepID=A0A5C3KU80_COPMA|nr:Clavaminate synthase-like protein [Coprinopsis marcescibilis]
MSAASDSLSPPSRPYWLADARTESTFEDIPVIDAAPAFSTNEAERRKLADKIRDASINVGFFYLKNHGIPDNAVTDALAAGKQFFSLPDRVKMELDAHKSENYKGYTALLAENTDVTGNGDLHEGFDIGWEQPGAELTSCLTRKGPMSGGNVWPSALPGFKEAVLSYYHSCLALGQALYPLFAMALDLPEGWFDDKTNESAAIMRLLHYPPQDPTNLANDKRQIGIGAHTDYECFTVLWQDPAGGLQVQNTSGEWVDAVPIPGTVVVNLGDQFARWTNDVFKSTPHRVINRSGLERYSIPVFFGTNYDTLLEPIETCISPDDPPKYEVTKAGDYVKSRLDATYAQSA